MQPLLATLPADDPTIQALRARIQELEEMLSAVGAGGVEPLKSTTSMSSTKPPTDYQVEQLAHRTCWRYCHSPDPAHSHTYTFNRHTLLEFVRVLREGGAA